MITSKVIYQGDLRTTCIHERSQAEIITDAPVDNHGKGEAFSPTDLTATSLATCMLTVMGIHAKSRELGIEGSIAEVTKVMAENPRRIAEIHIDIIILNQMLNEKETHLLEHIGLNCPVAKSLHPDIKQVVRFSYQ